ncbi:MAG: sulfatase [Chloroflexi bacterium]|nr:sulfatase [Chloroflexota bacterium]
MTRPNILYLHSHDTGRYIQPFGHAVPMPAYQRFAEQGVLFRQNFCAGPTCSPSRAALLTGQYPHNCGQFGLVNMGFELEHPERHVAWTLRNAGNATTLIGIQHVVKEPVRTGYEQRIAGGIRSAEEIAPHAVEFLRAYAGGPNSRPFFLDVGFWETHRVFLLANPSVRPAEDARYCLPPAPLPDMPETRRDMADFKAGARILDAHVGQVLDALDDTGLAENTLVILTTDHGIAFPHMKCNLTDHGIGVLLIVRGPGGGDNGAGSRTGWPDGFSGGKVVDAMVTHLDVFPTICDVAGIEHPDWLQGRSLVPLVRGEVDVLHDEVFAEVNYHVPYEPQRAVRTTRWKYIRRYDRIGKPLLANCDDGPSKDVWLAHGWSDQDTAPEQLYDLVFDPVERHNLASDTRYAAVLDEMRARLDRWMRDTNDPLLEGPIPTPPGARVGDPASVSPRSA